MVSIEKATANAPSKQGVLLRVLHIHSGNLYGGVESFLRTMAQLRAHAPSVKVEFALCFDARLAQELRDTGSTVHDLGPARFRSPGHVLSAQKALALVMNSGRYDVAVCHNVWSLGLFGPTVRRSGARLVFYMHDVPNRRGWLDQWAARTRPDMVLCNSRFTEASGRWLFKNTPRRVLRYPSALEGPVDAGERVRLRAALGASSDDVVIIQAARMQPWKGQRLLLDALAHLRTPRRWKCWLAGGAQRPSEHAFERELRRFAASLSSADQIQFLGQRDDVPSLLRAADIHCQPNLGPEPFGLAFVEALAAGLPVVTTRMGGPLEILNASCGVLVAPDAQAVASALAELIEDDCKRASLSRAGPARARELCDPVARAHDLVEELTAVALPLKPMKTSMPAAVADERSDDAIVSAVAGALRARERRHEVIVDLGCGRADCLTHLRGMFDTYVGCDGVRYDGFPESDRVRFQQIDLNRSPYPLETAFANAVIAIETIKHLENPRAFVREMARIVRPRGWVVITTPNQLSLMRKLHLGEADLRRITQECGLVDVEITYTGFGRIPLTAAHWPRRLGARGRWFSDNVILVARRP
jgi:glycosyltransferase involved in cell wall biosynthesis